MQNRLTTKAIFFDKQTWLLFAGFFLARIVSFALHGHQIIQALLVFFILMLLGILYYKNEYYGWAIVLTELFLGGSGHFIEFFGLSLRTCIVLTFITLWALFNILDPGRKHRLKIPHGLFWIFIPLIIFAAISAVIGLFNGHSVARVIQDFMPFSFLVLLLPAYHMFENEKIRHHFIRLVMVFIIGSALFALFTFVLYRLGLSELQDPFYKWMRDVAMAKITQVTPFFYRVVLPEHLLSVPVILITMSLLMRDEKHHTMWRILLFFGLFLLAINFSRAYLLGFAVGILVLKYRHSFKQWFKESAVAVLLFLFIFSSMSVISSIGKSTGLEILGLRIGSIVSPQTEVSTNARMEKLAPIISLIRKHPFVGNGLGASILYYDKTIGAVTPSIHFDWGYLEMWAELGILGSVWLLLIALFIVFEIIKKIRTVADFHDFKVGLLAAIVSMLIINITTPALFHTLSIFALTFVIAFITRPVEVFDYFITMIYRIFNRLD